MSVPALAHCQVVLVTPVSGSVRVAVSSVPTIADVGITVTDPSSSASVTVTVTSLAVHGVAVGCGHHRDHVNVVHTGVCPCISKFGARS